MISSIKDLLRKHYPSINPQDLKGSKVQNFVAGSFITHSGHFLNEALVMLEGEAFLVVPRDLRKGFDLDNMARIHKFREGEVINRIEIQYRCTSMQNIYSPGESSVLVIDHDTYMRVFPHTPLPKAHLNTTLPFLQQLPKRFLHLLESNTTTQQYKRNSKLFLCGQPCKNFYSLVCGQISINMPKTKQPKTQSQFFLQKVHYKEVLTISDGEYFGFEDEQYRSYEAQVKSVAAKVLEVNLYLVRYVCKEGGVEMRGLAGEKRRLMGRLAMNPMEDAGKVREPIEFRPEKAVPKSHKSVFYTNSVRSSRCTGFAKRDIPPPQLKSKPQPTLYQFNCMKYGTNFRKKKFLQLLKLLKMRQQQLGSSPQIQLARKAIRRCQLSPYDIVQIKDQLTGGTPSNHHFTQMSDKHRIRLISSRKAYRQLQSLSLSQIKAEKRRFKTDGGDEGMQVGGK